jgi:hypothetical protein
MFLECRLDIADPLQRNLDLHYILGVETQGKWDVDRDTGHHYFTTMKTFVELQGEDGILAKLNNVGLINRTTGAPFKVLSQEEYRRQIRESVCTIM